MMTVTDEEAKARLDTAAALHALGISVQREKLRRAFPTAGPREIEQRLRDWLGHAGFAEPEAPLVARPPRVLTVDRG